MKTREKICLALFKMIQNKSIYDVTITDIVNEANISRGSFYNHFKDIKSVVVFIEDTFVNDLRHCVHLTGDVEKDVIDTIDEITAAFRKIADGSVNIAELKESSGRCARELLDYRKLAARLYQ